MNLRIEHSKCCSKKHSFNKDVVQLKNKMYCIALIVEHHLQFLEFNKVIFFLTIDPSKIM